MEKYIKVRKIGEGSFGVAFLARTKENGKQVVLKEINMNKMTSKESDEARKEVSVLAQLKHSNIVSYLESFELSGNLFIVMDFCDGGDLFGRISAQHGTLFPEEQILDWFVQMCLAVKHIHDRKILHRDIKSQNIFLTKHGIVKLGDFGIAKVLNSTVELARTCIGTPYYLSPEICEARPYNNKSDIWSLGCVLYELTTLKHAFEAASMKALVLNIVRGIYPPPSSKYSAELRNLIALLFKKNPRDRPSVNTVLKKPLLQAKIRKFLSELEIAEEFSHTVMHGMKIQKAIQAPQPRPLPPRPSSAAGKQPPPSPCAPRYNPASVYGPSVACRKSRENLCKDNKKSPEVRKSVGQDRPNIRRPSSSGNSRPPSAGPVQDIAKRRQEFIEKEKERREEVRKKQEQEYARQHRELMEKQKLSRMNRNREDGWRNVLNSSNCEEKDVGGAGANAIVVRKIGNYDQHLAQLRRLEEKAQDPVTPSQPNTPKPAECIIPSQAAKLGQQAGNPVAVVADKARIYEEFIQRKEAAALNRARAQGGIALPLNPIPSPLKPAWAVAPSANSPIPGPSGDRTPVPRVDDDKKKEELIGAKPGWVAPVSDQVSSSPSDRPSSARIRDEERRKQEEEYMAKLRQIRLQNFNERCLREKNAAQIRSPANLFQGPESVNNEAELRKKKIEALRAQAEARAKKLKDELEERRKQAVEEKQRLQEPQAAIRPIGLLPNKVDPSKPSVGLTAAIAAIGAAVPERVEPVDVRASVADQDKSSIKKTKQEILKRINSNISKPNAPQRGKWAEAGVTNILGEMELETKGKWTDAGVTNVLGEMDLEENHPFEIESKTPGAKELEDIRDASGQEGNSVSTPTPRRQWPTQRGTVVDILSSAAICEATRGATVAIKSSKLGANNTSVIEPRDDVSTVNEVVGVEVDAEGSGTVGDGQKTTTIETKDVEDENSNDLKVKTELLEPSKQDEPPIVDENRRQESDSCSEELSEDGKENPADGRLEGVYLESLSAELEKSSDEDRLEVDDLEGPETLDEEEDGKLFQTGKGLSLKQGLTTGHFDAADVKLLRTCSEPDLHKLSLSKQPREKDKMKLPVKSSSDIRNEDLSDLELAERSQAMVDEDLAEEEESGLDFSIADLDTEEPDETMAKDDFGNEGTVSETLPVESEEDGDVGEDSDDSDLKTLRETMANILASKDHESSGEETLTSTATKTKKKTKKGKCSKKGKKKKTKESLSEESKSLTKVWSDASLDDFQSMKETMKSLLQPTKPSGSNAVKPKSTLTLSMIAESSYVCEVNDSQQEENLTTLVPFLDSSDSDIDRMDDEYFEDDGIFAHLEGIRASLEDQLGCETFLKAYATVQSFQEEDEDMEEGIKTVTRILGPDNVYLYPSILQLVMADAAFADNG